MNYKTLSLSNKQKWKKYFQKLPVDQQDVYYTPEYYELYENYGDGKAQCFVFERDGELALYPFLLNSVNELGYDLDKEYYDIQGAYGYNGVVTSSYKEHFRKAFYKQFNKYCIDNNIIAEFTRFSPILSNHQFTENYMDVIYDRNTVNLNLSQSYNNIWKTQYSSKNRNKIRKGRKDLLCEISNDRNLISGFKQIYYETMQRIGADKYYYFSDEYFDNLLFGNNQIINVYDKRSNKLKASMVLMIHKNYAHYHLSGRASNCKNNSVNNFMLDEAIKVAQISGCKLFHFGGGNSKNEKDSLLKFKQNFSKDNGNFFIGKKIHNKKVYKNIVSQWKTKDPVSYKNHANKILGYREIK